MPDAASRASATGAIAIDSIFTGRNLARDSAIYWGVVAALAVLGPFVGDNYFLHVFTLAFIWCVVIASWDLILGYAGVFSYAQLVFFAVGAYASALISIHAGVTPFLSMLLGALAGLVAGLLVALPSLRLKGEYVALFTFTVHLALPPIIQQGKAIGLGGATGLLGIPWPEILGHRISTIDKLAWFWVALAVGAVSVYLIYFVVLRGRIGLAFVAMRDADAFAQAIGVDGRKYTVLAFMISALFTALAGGLYAHYTSVVTPKILGTEFFLMAMVMLAIGGMGRFPGAVLGVFLVVIGNELLRQFDDYRLFLLGVAVVAVVVYVPRGAAGFFRRAKPKTIGA